MHNTDCHHKQNDLSYRDVILRMYTNGAQTIWWELSERNDAFCRAQLSKLPYANQTNNNIIYVFNDKLYPPSLSPYIGGGYVIRLKK